MSRPRNQTSGLLFRSGCALALVASLAGCPIADLEGTGSPGGGTVDAGAVDAGPVDATADGAVEAGSDAGAADAGSGTYYALDDPQRWTFFDVASVGGGINYSGVAFDGRYLYFAPDFSPPVVLRYDTQCATCSQAPGTLTDPMAWSTHPLMPDLVAAGGSSAGAYPYLGAAFDGQYVYFAPFATNTFAVQYDTQSAFDDDGAWSVFDASTLDPSADYWGVATDGQHTYLVPNATTTIVSYDNSAAGSGDGGSGFSAQSSWSSYDLGAGSDYQGFWGGLYDGHYLYLAPFSGNVASRHVSNAPLGSSWSLGSTDGFDFSIQEQISPPHFWGSAYDGLHVYFVPYKTNELTFAAFTATGQFNDDGAWATFSLTQLFAPPDGGTTIVGALPGFVGAAYDGQRIFLAPAGQVATSDGNVTPLQVVTYDTKQPLTSAAAYTTFDPTALPGGARAYGFEGAAFDGQYVYFVPHAGSVVARFQATHTNMGLSPVTYRGSWW
jgi:hypothetical protein